MGLVAIGTNAIRVAEKKHDGSSADYVFDEGTKNNKCNNND